MAALSPRHCAAALGRLAEVLASPLGSVIGAKVDDAVALTFDDGPGPWTGRVLDVLARHGATATFFVLVDRAEAEPELLRRIVAAGHEVGLHGLDHRRLTNLEPDLLGMHLAEGKRRLERCTAQALHWFRPPFGAQNLRSFVAARRVGLDVVGWSADAEDWLDHDPSSIAALGVARAQAGGVLLLHDAFASDAVASLPEPTFDRAAALDLMLTAWATRGWRGLSVGRLLAAGRARRALWFRS